jgi:hypothetical protein
VCERRRCCDEIRALQCKELCRSYLRTSSTLLTGTPAGGCTHASTIPDENRRERDGKAARTGVLVHLDGALQKEGTNWEQKRLGATQADPMQNLLRRGDCALQKLESRQEYQPRLLDAGS